jgi:hypothetical protein
MAVVELVQGFQEADALSVGVEWIQKDPQALKEYQRDWTAFLADTGGDVLASVSWLISNTEWVELTPGAGVLAIEGGAHPPSFTDLTATVWLSGGTAGVSYMVTCRVVTAAGRKEDSSFQVRLIER